MGVDPTTGKIAWIAIIIGVLMQVFASFGPGGSSLTQPFTDIDGDTAIDDVAQALLETILGFLQQSWAEPLPDVIQFVVAIIFDLALILLVSSSLALTITAIVAALIAFIEALIP